MPTLKKVSRIRRKGQVTIPVEIRKKLGLEEGDLVAFIETEQGIIISPQEVIASEALDEIGQALKDKGISLDELIESGRDMRGELIEKEYNLPSNP